MLKKIISNNPNTLFVLVSIVAFILTLYFDTVWFFAIPLTCYLLFIFYSLLFGKADDDFELKDDVRTYFSTLGYTIIAERSLNFLERMNRDSDWEISVVSISNIPIHRPKFLRKYHRVFTVTTIDDQTLDVLTEIVQHLDREITIEVLGTKPSTN